MPTPLRLLAACVIALQISSSAALAEPLQVASGKLWFDTGGPPTFRLLTSSGQLFEAEGFRQHWSATACFFDCSPGTAIPMSLVATESASDGSPFFQANGVDLFPDIDFVFSAPSVTLGSGTPNEPFEDFVRPFTFAGQLTGYASPDRSGSPAFDVTLTGRGTARLSMALENGRYHFSSLDYDFEAAPVPEPGTLLLVGAGAVLIWGRRCVHR
jgi:hypothetical protein